MGHHTDGSILPVLDILNPVEPRAGMRVAELKGKYGTRLAFMGGMCNSDVLINGPKERIVWRTEELIDAGRDGGGKQCKHLAVNAGSRFTTRRM